MKNESMVGRRLYAWMIDALILFVLVFVFDWLVSTPLMNNVTEIFIPLTLVGGLALNYS